MNPETVIQQEILLAVGGRPQVRLWRNNRGVARRRGADGQLGRPVEFGLGPGSADLVGLARWGAIGRFLAIEVKTPEAYSKPHHGLSKDQRTWRDIVLRFGGIYIVAFSAEHAANQLEAELQSDLDRQPGLDRKPSGRHETARVGVTG